MKRKFGYSSFLLHVNFTCIAWHKSKFESNRASRRYCRLFCELIRSKCTCRSSDCIYELEIAGNTTMIVYWVSFIKANCVFVRACGVSDYHRHLSCLGSTRLSASEVSIGLSIDSDYSCGCYIILWPGFRWYSMLSGGSHCERAYTAVWYTKAIRNISR